jgi:hypothetical protein
MSLRLAAARRCAAALIAALAAILSGCTAAPPPPTHFGRWGPISPVHEPERSVLLAAIASVAAGHANSIVLARYAGDRDRRLDLAPLAGEARIAVDASGRLGPIDTGMPEYRARVFEYDFPGRTTILELSVPAIRGDAATLNAWRWDALAWKCELPGKKEAIALRRVDGRWTVAATTPDPGSQLLRKDCPPDRSAASSRPAH